MITGYAVCILFIADGLLCLYEANEKHLIKENLLASHKGRTKVPTIQESPFSAFSNSEGDNNNIPQFLLENSNYDKLFIASCNNKSSDKVRKNLSPK